MIRNFEKTLLAAVICFLISCTPPSPEQLAKETCNCFEEAKALKNADNAIEAAARCSGVAQMNMQRLRKMEQQQDMTDEQVKIFEDRFNNVYKNCK